MTEGVGEFGQPAPGEVVRGGSLQEARRIRTKRRQPRRARLRTGRNVDRQHGGGYHHEREQQATEAHVNQERGAWKYEGRSFRVARRISMMAWRSAADRRDAYGWRFSRPESTSHILVYTAFFAASGSASKAGV